MATTVLVVEDELKLRELLRAQLERAGYVTLTTGAGAEAIELVGTASPELVLLDLRLPDLSGEAVAREIRLFSDVPIVMLTAKTGEEDRIRGLEAGADDYLTKPFSPRELLLRLQAILRRGRAPEAVRHRLSFGGGELILDETTRQVIARNKEVMLTPTEWGIITSLARHPGRVYSRTELINRVRGYEYSGYERIVDVHVKNLRRKLERDSRQPRVVVTVLGGGYRLGLSPDG